MKIVVISPHRDDAAFSLGLAIAGWLAAGHSVNVINCFTLSDYAPFSALQSMHPESRIRSVTALRLREDETWGKLLGDGLTLTNLQLKDAPLRLNCSANDVCGMIVTSADGALLTIREALGDAQADALALPLALGGHVDHRTAREAAIPGESNARPCAFYEDLPYAARPGAAATIEDASYALDAGLTPIFTSAMTDPDSAARRKRRQVLCYPSQVDDEVTEQIAGFCARYGGRERLWANAAWHSSKLAVQAAGCLVTGP